MSSVAQTLQVSPAPSYEPASSDLGSRDPLSSTPRSLPQPLSNITHILAQPPILPGPQAHGVIVSIAKGAADEPFLHGVVGDLPYVLDELGGKTTGTLHVVADFEPSELCDTVQVLPPTSQSVRTAIKDVERVMKPGDLFFVYLAGHTSVDSNGIASMPLPENDCLRGDELASGLEDVARKGGIVMVFADVCHSSAFLKMHITYNVDNKGSLSFSRNESPTFREGQMIIFSATELGQLSRTISVSEGKYPGLHGLFTWALFQYLRKQPQQVDIARLFFYLRQHSAWHKEKPSPQLSATIEGLQQLPIGRLSA